MPVSDVVHVETNQDASEKKTIRLTIPPRFYLVPGTAIIMGTIIGLTRGARKTSLQFLAENVHRPPTTVQGWYFYNKTKNYKVMLGGLKGAGLEASRLGLVAFSYVGIEEGLQQLGWGEAKEVGAAIGTAGFFSAVYKLPWRMTGRAMLLGGVIGSSLKLLVWGRKQLIEAQGSDVE